MVIFAGEWKFWRERPDVFYRGRTLHDTGEVKLYKGAPEMILNGPEQVVVKFPASSGEGIELSINSMGLSALA